MEESTSSKIGHGLLGLGLVGCSMEMVEGWGILGLDWPPLAFYGIAAVIGLVSGALCGGKYILPALIGYPLVAVGALMANGWLLSSVDTVHSVMMLLVGGLGALPGIGIYWVLRSAQDSIGSSPE